jgi:hypothetical protein
MASSESLGKRLGRFILLLGAIFAIAAAVLVTQKLSHDALALLIGLSCGVAAMLPTIVLGVLVWRRESARRHEQGDAHRQMGHPYTPPVIVVSPQGLPGNGYGQYPALSSSNQFNGWSPAAGQRDFKIVGGVD